MRLIKPIQPLMRSHPSTYKISSFSVSYVGAGNKWQSLATKLVVA